MVERFIQLRSMLCDARIQVVRANHVSLFQWEYGFRWRWLLLRQQFWAPAPWLTLWAIQWLVCQQLRRHRTRRTNFALKRLHFVSLWRRSVSRRMSAPYFSIKFCFRYWPALPHLAHDRR